jgi:hypothetical protein
MSKSQYIRLILLLAGIVITLGSTQLIYFKVMNSVKSGTIGKINGIVEGKIDAEITIWGASTALLNFNPVIISDSLNMSVFNMGINGTNIDQYNGLLTNYIKGTHNSKYIIIALDIFGGLDKRNNFYELHNWLHHIYKDDIYDCLSTIDRYTMFKAKYIPFYSITLFDKHSFSHFRNQLKQQNTAFNFADLGYKPENLRMKESENDTALAFSININGAVFNKLHSSCLLAKKRNIQPIVVITPCFYKGLEKITNSEEFVKQIYLLKKDDIVVMNYLDCAISHDQANFKDNTHLNSQGADIFSRLLSNDLKALIVKTP